MVVARRCTRSCSREYSSNTSRKFPGRLTASCGKANTPMFDPSSSLTQCSDDDLAPTNTVCGVTSFRLLPAAHRMLTTCPPPGTWPPPPPTTSCSVTPMTKWDEAMRSPLGRPWPSLRSTCTTGAGSTDRRSTTSPSPNTRDRSGSCLTHTSLLTATPVTTWRHSLGVAADDVIGASDVIQPCEGACDVMFNGKNSSLPVSCGVFPVT